MNANESVRQTVPPQDPAPLRPVYVDPTDAHDVSRYGSGKFRLNVDAYAYSLSLDGCSPTVGGIDDFGRYYVRVDGPFLEGEAREHDSLTAKDVAFLGTVAGAILSEDDQGFVSAVWFATDAALEYAWGEAEEWEARLIAELEEADAEEADDDDDEEDEEDDDDKPGRETYRNGQPIGLTANGCDGCSPLTINGVFCHETGCEYAWKDSPISCFECGRDFLRQTDRHERTCPDCVHDAEERAEEAPPILYRATDRYVTAPGPWEDTEDDALHAWYRLHGERIDASDPALADYAGETIEAKYASAMDCGDIIAFDGDGEYWTHTLDVFIESGRPSADDKGAE